MVGSYHPFTLLLRKASQIFEDLGFEIVEGNEVTNEWYNFDSLRIPKWHPARDVQDTFYTKDGKVLRTHTSAMQVKSMETRKPPVRIIVPGRCFRNEATDASHEANFYQLEGFAIDKNIQMKHLIGTLKDFTQRLFGEHVECRFSPAYFPFVEPGMEMAISYSKGKDKKWLEILGAGMIHPEVLKNMKVDPENYSGFAFGMGLDRLAKLIFKLDDIRLNFRGDLRFLKQFSGQKPDPACGRKKS